MANIFSLIIAYLIGSLNSAVLVSKYLKFPDPRNTGSGNPGATNILRTIGKNEAIVVLLADAFKGLLAVLIGRIFGVEAFMLGLVALAAVAGHIFPVFFKFKGGKGVATMLGATFMLTFWVGLFASIVWIVIAYLLRYASLASIVAAVCAPLFMLIFGNHQYAFPLLLVAALIIWRHWENIERLRSGTESKIDFGSKKQPPSPPSQPPSDAP